MPNLLSRVLGIQEFSSGRRPQMSEFTGINWNVPTAEGMVACFPMWEPPGMPALDLGPLQLVAYPVGTILRTQDPYFGDVYKGDGTVRYYKVSNGNSSVGIDFGRGPYPFAVSFWAQVSPPAPGTDYYVFAFDNPAAGFSGYTCSFDTSANVSFSTANPTTVPTAVKTTFNPFDGQWHHYCFAHIPGIAGGSGGAQSNYVDGKLDSQSPSATFTPTATIGSFGAANLYLGIDDDGATGAMIGQFCDFRIYQGVISDDRAAAMYHPDTRWEIYFPAKKAYWIAPAPAAPAGNRIRRVIC